MKKHLKTMVNSTLSGGDGQKNLLRACHFNVNYNFIINEKLWTLTLKWHGYERADFLYCQYG